MLVDMFVCISDCRCSPVSVSLLRVYLSATHAACGNYIGIVKTLQEALLPFVFARSRFPPTAGRQGWLGWLLGWHSLDDLGRQEGRHTAIHSYIMYIKNRKAELV